MAQYRVLGVVGDFYHGEKPIRDSLESAVDLLRNGGLNGEDGGGETKVRLDFGTTDELAAALAGSGRPDAVVLFKENRLDPERDGGKLWMDTETEEAIAAYVRAGGAWLAWHSGMASYPTDGAYAAMLRGWFLHHPSEHKTVRYEPTGDFLPPTSAGFELLDEHYFVQCDVARTDVFLRSVSPDGQSIAGWRHPFGEGRVLGLTPAHRPEGLADPAMRRLLAECLAWCIRRDE